MDRVIQIADETLRLLPERAVYWPRTRTLFIADTHFGYPGRGGPRGASQVMADDLERLTAALVRVGAGRLIVLGDLFNAPGGFTEANKQAFAAWRAQHADLPITLINGNHDIFTLPDAWRIKRVDGPTPGPYFVLMHQPQLPNTGFGLAGHLHPAMIEHTDSGLEMRVPCFWFTDALCVLPAFSSVVGLAVIHPRVDNRVFSIRAGRVIHAFIDD